MTHPKNKVDWCLKKAEKELEKGNTHRGLIKVRPSKKQMIEHVAKAEHDLRAAIRFSEVGFSDWSASAFFYSIYQSFLAIANKFGYESGNQECTFALMYSLSEEEKIDFDKSLLDKVAAIDAQKPGAESTSVRIREKYQYGTDLSLKEDLYEELLELTQTILSKTKEIIEE